MKSIVKIFLGCALSISSLLSFAQSAPAGYTLVKSNEAFKTQMLNTAKNMTTLQSEFKQTKHIAGMTKEIVQMGKFYFKKEDKLLLDYLTPMKSQIILNGSKIKMVSGTKSQVLDANTNPAVANLKNMLSSCLSGQLPTNSSDMSLVIYENDSQFLVCVTPKAGSNLSKKTDHIEVLIKKETYDILSVKMIEKPKSTNAKDADTMEFTFTNMQKNSPIDDKNFNIQ